MSCTVSYTIKRHLETGGNSVRKRSDRPKPTTESEDNFLRVNSLGDRQIEEQQLQAQLNTGRGMSGMMTNAVGGPSAGVGGLSDISSLIEAGQQFAQQIQQQNPELIEQLRNHIRSRSFSGSADDHS